MTKANMVIPEGETGEGPQIMNGTKITLPGGTVVNVPYVVPCGPNGPVEPAREKVCIASITETDLTDNVYTVTGEPAKRIELINDGAGELTVTISDGTNTTSKVLKPDDVYDQNFTAITTLTFSTGAVFRADILR